MQTKPKSVSIITISSKNKTKEDCSPGTQIKHCYEHDGSEESFERETLKAHKDIRDNLQEILASMNRCAPGIKE